MNYSYRHRGADYEVELLSGEGSVRALLDGKAYELLELDRGAGELHFELDGELTHLDWARQGRDIWLHFDGRSYHLQKGAGGRGAVAGSGPGERALRAPMPGQVREVLVKEGDEVEAGAVLLLLEAMKMEIRIQAPRAAKVVKLAVGASDSVEREQILVELDAI